MKRIHFSGFLLLVFLLVAATGCKPPKTVDYVEVDRYLGTWYEIARFPNSFQADCVSNTTATYSPHPDSASDILVENRCQEEGSEGSYQEILGRARIADEETNAKLSVIFFEPFGAPYWIIELDDTEGGDPYAWAVVSDPFRVFLWILSRTPTLPEETLDTILAKITLQGYDTERLVWTPQDV